MDSTTIVADVTFLSLNKKVTKEISLRGAVSRAPARQIRLAVVRLPLATGYFDSLRDAPPSQESPGRTWGGSEQLNLQTGHSKNVPIFAMLG